MTPHRLQPVASMLSIPHDAGPGVIAGLVALAASFYNLHVAVLFIFVVAGGMVDLYAGARRARVHSRLQLPGGYDRQILDDGVSGKLVKLAASIFMGASLDAIGSLIGGATDLGFASLLSTYTPFTTAFLLWRWQAEAASILQNVEATPGGKGALWPGAMKVIDEVRFRLAHPAAAGGLPQDRWGDHVSSDERAWLDQMLAERRSTPRPPDPQEGQ